VFVYADVQGELDNVWNDPLGTTGDNALLTIGNGPTDYGFGSYNIRITNIGSGGSCTAVDSFRLIVTPNPAPVISGSSTYCSNGGSTTLDAGPGYANYSWSNATGVIGTSRTITVSTAGVYTVTVTGIGGCTGTASKTVTTQNPVVSTTTVAACDSFVWNNSTYHASGVYTFAAGLGVNHCDSTATLNLTINPSYNDTQVVAACQQYTWIDGNTYTQSGYYVFYSSTLAGCDSALTLDLTINTGCSNGVALDLTMFLEGYYAGSSTMTSVLMNQGIGNTIGTEVDTILVELRDSLDPSIVVDQANLLLMTDGTASGTFLNAQPGTSYWIVIKHRMSIQTWSAAEVMFSAAGTTYDFSSSSSQAYGSNEREVETGVWAIYSADLNQDEFVDAFDYPIFDNDRYNFASGYYASDMNGDGFVDSFDYPIFDLNRYEFVGSVHP